MEQEIRCPMCGNDRLDMLEKIAECYPTIRIMDGKTIQTRTYLCNICSKTFYIQPVISPE